MRSLFARFVQPFFGAESTPSPRGFTRPWQCHGQPRRRRKIKSAVVLMKFPLHVYDGKRKQAPSPYQCGVATVAEKTSSMRRRVAPVASSGS